VGLLYLYIYVFTIYLGTLSVPYAARRKEEYELREFRKGAFTADGEHQRICSLKPLKNKKFSVL
jgi:hypothetical protein